MTTLTQILTQIAPFLIGLLLLGVWLWSGIWIARDAAVRGKPGMLVSVLALLIAWPVSLLVWIALRPENIRPPFDLDQHRIQ